jgi:hypothetical protein
VSLYAAAASESGAIVMVDSVTRNMTALVESAFRPPMSPAGRTRALAMSEWLRQVADESDTAFRSMLLDALGLNPAFPGTAQVREAAPPLPSDLVVPAVPADKEAARVWHRRVGIYLALVLDAFAAAGLLMVPDKEAVTDLIWPVTVVAAALCIALGLMALDK